jgi:hypothetical protein
MYMDKTKNSRGYLPACKPHLLFRLDDNKARLTQSISLMPQTYSEDAQIRQLCLRQLVQHQLDRVARALLNAGV